MTVPGSGLGGQLMLAEETTWGTQVAVTRALTFDNESLKFTKKPVQGLGLQAGAFTQQGGLRADTASWVAGDIQLDHTSKNMGLLWKHALGAFSVATVGGTATKQTFNLGSSIVGKGLTIQAGRPTTDGTVRARTYAGCKITSWELDAAATDIVKLKVSVIGKSRDTAAALGTPTYPTGNNVFYFKEGAITVGGNPYIAIRDISLMGDNMLAADRFYFGNAGLIAEPIRKDFTKLTGKFTADYVDTSMSDAYVADSELAIVLTFTSGVSIGTSTFETLALTSNGVRLNGDEETISSADILNNAVTFDNLGPKAGGTQFQVDYTTLDAAP